MIHSVKPVTLFAVAITGFFLLGALVCPTVSCAKMKPIDEDIVISWAPEPPLFFRVNWNKTPALSDIEYEGPPWYGPWFKDKNLVIYDDRIVPLFKDEEEVITLWPSTCTHDICKYENSYSSCDWDGLACKSHTLLGPVTFYGCVGTQGIVVGEIDAKGKNEVYQPPMVGGPFVHTNGYPFLKIVFPENNTATMKYWEGTIVAGQQSNLESYNTCPCADSHCAASPNQGRTPIDPSQSYGTVSITDLKVTIHSGGWVQMWMENSGIDFEQVSYGIIKGRWDP